MSNNSKIKKVIVDAIRNKVKYYYLIEGVSSLEEKSGNVGIILSDMIKQKAFADYVDLHIILPPNTAFSTGY